jgi:hypothetical protein
MDFIFITPYEWGEISDKLFKNKKGGLLNPP